MVLYPSSHAVEPVLVSVSVGYGLSVTALPRSPSASSCRLPPSKRNALRAYPIVAEVNVLEQPRKPGPDLGNRWFRADRAHLMTSGSTDVTIRTPWTTTR